MLKLSRLSGRSLLAALAMLAVEAGATVSPVEVIAVSSPSGTPYQVSVQQAGDQLRIAGMLRKGPASKGRHLRGKVKIDVLDAQGKVIDQFQTKLHRVPQADPAHRAAFELEITRWPAQGYSIRASYH